MWVVMKRQDFEFEPKFVGGLEVKHDMGKMIGYLPIYETREDAEADFPGATIWKAKEKP